MITCEKPFKEQAVKLAGEVGTAKAAKDLGVPENTLYTWVRKSKEDGATAHIGSGNKRQKNDVCSDIHEKDKRIKELEKANEILQDALSYSPRANSHYINVG